jgi:hypothetical protein
MHAQGMHLAFATENCRKLMALYRDAKVSTHLERMSLISLLGNGARSICAKTDDRTGPNH